MLKKVGKHYWVDTYVDGKRVRRSLKTSVKSKALLELRTLQKYLEASGGREGITLDALCKKYIDYAWTDKPKSAQKEEQRLEKIKAFWKSEFQITRLSEITPYHVEQLKSALRSGDISKGRSGRTGLSKATTNYYLQLLRGMFYKAIDWELYSKPNPLKKVRFYRLTTRRETLSQSQIQKVIETSQEISRHPRSPLQKIFSDLVILALNTGMRKGEILNLGWQSVKADELRIKGKGDIERTIPLNVKAKAIIEKQPRRNEYVFDIPNRNQHDLFRRTVGRIRKKTDIDFNFHVLRHCFTTSLIEKRVDLITISEILGHSKLTTSLIYSHTDKKKKQKAVELLLE